MSIAASDTQILHKQRDIICQQLMSAGEELPNKDLFASILSSWKLDIADMPARLGMDEPMFEAFWERYFSGLPLTEEYRQLGSGADPERLPERQELLDLMLRYRADRDESEVWLAHIVVGACMGGNHLWQDLGLWSRNQLSALMNNNFPGLAELNSKDMKWKKFLYKQLCQEEGIYVCRAPSCEVCSDYDYCFGPEE